jgi:hypothetical protein
MKRDEVLSIISGFESIFEKKISPKWLVDLTIEELRNMAKEYEKPRPPEPIIINGVAIHKNQMSKLLEYEKFKKNDNKNVEVSNLGRIKYGDNILEQYDPKNNGYLFVDIKSIRKIVPEKVYRLVAETWLERPDPDELPKGKHFKYNTVHHISNNGYDNRIKNLMWVTEWQHAVIHPWIRTNKFNDEELTLLLRSYNEIKITPNDYKRMLDIAENIERTQESESQVVYWGNVVDAIIRLIHEEEWSKTTWMKRPFNLSDKGILDLE